MAGRPSKSDENNTNDKLSNIFYRHIQVVMVYYSQIRSGPTVPSPREIRQFLNPGNPIPHSLESGSDMNVLRNESYLRKLIAVALHVGLYSVAALIQ